MGGWMRSLIPQSTQTERKERDEAKAMLATAEARELVHRRHSHHHHYHVLVDLPVCDLHYSFMSAEELELENIAKEMEVQLFQQYRIVDRVIAERQNLSGEVEYLIKWEGLPYSEATWENLNFLLENSDVSVQAAVDNFQVRCRCSKDNGDD